MADQGSAGDRGGRGGGDRGGFGRGGRGNFNIPIKTILELRVFNRPNFGTISGFILPPIALEKVKISFD
jgi:hypothetical protein